MCQNLHVNVFEMDHKMSSNRNNMMSDNMLINMDVDVINETNFEQYYFKYVQLSGIRFETHFHSQRQYFMLYTTFLFPVHFSAHLFFCL